MSISMPRRIVGTYGESGIDRKSPPWCAEHSYVRNRWGELNCFWCGQELTMVLLSLDEPHFVTEWGIIVTHSSED